MRSKNTQVLHAYFKINTQLLRIMFSIYTQVLRIIECANMQNLHTVKNMSYFQCFYANFVHILNQILRRYFPNRISHDL